MGFLDQWTMSIRMSIFRHLGHYPSKDFVLLLHMEKKMFIEAVRKHYIFKHSKKYDFGLWYIEKDYA